MVEVLVTPPIGCVLRLTQEGTLLANDDLGLFIVRRQQVGRGQDIDVCITLKSTQ